MKQALVWKSEVDGQRVPGCVQLLDQTRLPLEYIELELSDPEQIWEAIKMLRVRGAPAIGVAAAMGVVLAVQRRSAGASLSELQSAADEAVEYLATSRPTAVNLFWALERMRRTAQSISAGSAEDFVDRLAEEALTIAKEDAACCRTIGRHGAGLIQSDMHLLTHCNAGALAATAYGTALAPMYHAWEEGRRFHVYVDETRPLLQGARLTVWELQEAGIPCTLICDNMAAALMKRGRVDAVFVGADRIAANGDAANKTGTYGLALAAHHHNIPFYVLAPTSTIDRSLLSGEAIPIEERDKSEVLVWGGQPAARSHTQVYNPAFDVTPAELITALVTEHGIIKQPGREHIAAIPES